MARTLGSHPGNRSSILRGAAIRLASLAHGLRPLHIESVQGSNAPSEPQRTEGLIFVLPDGLARGLRPLCPKVFQKCRGKYSAEGPEHSERNDFERAKRAEKEPKGYTQHMSFFFYLARCADLSLYTRSCSDIQEREQRQLLGADCAAFTGSVGSVKKFDKSNDGGVLMWFRLTNDAC